MAKSTKNKSTIKEKIANVITKKETKKEESEVNKIEEPVSIVEYTLVESGGEPLGKIEEVETSAPEELPVPETLAPFEKVEEAIVSTVEIKDEAVVELIPKFKEAEIKKENNAERTQAQIKKLRSKLENGTISDGEAVELFRLLSDH